MNHGLGLHFAPRNCTPGRPPAVLLGRMNLVRALGAAAIPTIVASPDPDEAAFASRYCSGRLLLPPIEQRRAAAEMLAEAGERLARMCGSRAPLYYGSDDYLDLVLEHRAMLEPHFRFILNDEAVAHALIDKQRFEDFARSRDLPVPRALSWEEVAGRDEPVLVKPKAKIEWDRARALLRLFGGSAKARVFASGRELAGDRHARSHAAELLLQEYVPGDDRQLYSFHGY